MGREIQALRRVFGEGDLGRLGAEQPRERRARLADLARRPGAGAGVLVDIAHIVLQRAFLAARRNGLARDVEIIPVCKRGKLFPERGPVGQAVVHRTLPSSRNSISAFWVCSRFSASSQTTLCLPSITCAETSSPRCAGRQCMNSASLRAAFIISASTCQSSKSF